VAELAVVTSTIDSIDRRGHSSALLSWVGLNNGDIGQVMVVSNLQDRAVQVFGPFGAGGSVRIVGSLDGFNFEPLTDLSGDPLVFTARGIRAVTEAVRFIRPEVTAGDGATDLTVLLNMCGFIQ